MRTNLFRLGEFTFHSGSKSYFKIDCDALTDADIKTLSCIIAKEFRYSKVIGIPKGGLRLAKACEEWKKEYGPLLIVDDVLTTGKSMEEEKAKYPYLYIIGVVIFARGPCPAWVYPIFDMERWFGFNCNIIA
jgi:orotate phosphoribosyltransferase